MKWLPPRSTLLSPSTELSDARAPESLAEATVCGSTCSFCHLRVCQTCRQTWEACGFYSIFGNHLKMKHKKNFVTEAVLYLCYGVTEESRRCPVRKDLGL